MQAMILAAGFGTRLQPYTNLRPKPLFPILNTPLLILTIQRLQEAGFDHIVINCHHLKEQFKTLFIDMPGVYLQEEEIIMGTGGGLGLALESLKDEPLLVTNGDIYHTVDYKRFYDEHVNNGSRITLAMHDYPRFNGVIVENNRLVSFDKKIPGESVAFTGLHMIDPSVLQPLSNSKKSCIIEWYRQLISKGIEIKVARVDDSYWTDMGTISDYLQLHGDLLTGKVLCWDQIQQRIQSHIFFDKNTQCGKNFEAKEWACIGNACIGDNVSISRSIIWDGAVIPDNSVITDSLIVCSSI